MDCDMEENEFNLTEVVDDVEMSDDELEKELKEIEKENENKLLEAQSLNYQNKETSKVDSKDSKTKENNNKHRSKQKADCQTLCNDQERNDRGRDHHDVRDHLDDRDRLDDSNRPDDRGHYGNNSRGFLDKSHIAKYDMFRERIIDYKRLNRSLHVSKSSDPMVIGREIAYRLQEPKMQLFGHVVRVLGFNMASEIFAETKEIVNRGGIKTDNGERRRSPGGTFLYVMKNRCYATPEQIKEIFKNDNETRKQAKKRKHREIREAEENEEGSKKKKPKKKKVKTKVEDEKVSKTKNKSDNNVVQGHNKEDLKVKTEEEKPSCSDNVKTKVKEQLKPNNSEQTKMDHLKDGEMIKQKGVDERDDLEELEELIKLEDFDDGEELGDGEEVILEDLEDGELT